MDASQIFISYAREDRPRAAALATVLAQSGWSVWWDREIPIGLAFDEVIEKALDGATCIIVLWSSHSVSSRWVKAEAQTGLERDRLVPALLEEEVHLPLAFRAIEGAQLYDWTGESAHPELDKLLSRVAELIADDRPKPSNANTPATIAPMAAPAVPQPSAGSRTRVRKIILLVCVALVGTAVGAWSLLGSPTKGGGPAPVDRMAAGPVPALPPAVPPRSAGPMLATSEKHNRPSGIASAPRSLDPSSRLSPIAAGGATCAATSAILDFDGNLPHVDLAQGDGRAFSEPAIDRTRARCGLGSLRVRANFALAGMRTKNGVMPSQTGEVYIKLPRRIDLTSQTLTAHVFVDGPADVPFGAQVSAVNNGVWVNGTPLLNQRAGSWITLRHKFDVDNRLYIGGSSKVNEVEAVAIEMWAAGSKAQRTWIGNVYIDDVDWR